MARPSIEDLLEHVAAEKHGVISGASIRKHGFSIDIIKSAVRRGQLKRVASDTFVAVGAPESFRQAAAIASSSGGVCSHRCAAALYGLDGVRPYHVEIVTPTGYPVRRYPASVIVHRTNHLPDDHVDVRAGVPVTCVSRTLIDLAGVAGFSTFRRAAISAVDRDLVTPNRIAALMTCCGRSGRPGTASVRRLLQEMDWQKGMTDSDLEDKAVSLIEEEDLPTPKRLFRVFSEGRFLGEVDLAYPKQRVAVEVDSYQHHSDRMAFVKDRARSNGLVARAGWSILYFVYEDSLRPRLFLDDLRAALAANNRTLSSLKCPGDP